MADSPTSARGRHRIPVAATSALMVAAALSLLSGCGHDAAPAHALPVAPATARPTPAATAPAVSAAQRLSADGLTESVPQRVQIPSIRLDAPLAEMGQGADGSIDTPPFSQPGTAGWYGGSVTPGEVGTSLIVGHVDTHRGPAVFYLLSALRKGDTVQVARSDHSTAVFSIDSIQVIPRTGFDDQKVYADADRPELRLITCGGTFSRKQPEYSSNVVVFAHLTGVHRTAGQ
ncbi:class F sortase [Streptacidiphilus sp. N1-10]|uniref:Class F sortase n=1 Tax=Streptacidiphilus jeojiensis TaxID=3229225 RepID=A0ABV6XZ15_9ACTN